MKWLLHKQPQQWCPIKRVLDIVRTTKQSFSFLPLLFHVVALIFKLFSVVMSPWMHFAFDDFKSMPKSIEWGIKWCAILGFNFHPKIQAITRNDLLNRTILFFVSVIYTSGAVRAWVCILCTHLLSQSDSSRTRSAHSNGFKRFKSSVQKMSRQMICGPQISLDADRIIM